MIEWNPLFITLKLALITTCILLIVAVPFAYWLAYARVKGKFFIEAVVALPLVLPPSVLGFYLLIAFSNQSFPGSFLEQYFDIKIPFTFTGLVIGSLVYSLPFMVQPIQSGFQHLPPSIKEASYTLGKSRLETLMRVLLPNMRSSLITGVILSFAHTIGEFGVVLMIGGNLDGTRVASIAVYDSVNKLEYNNAHIYSGILLLFSFSVLSIVYFFNKRGFTSLK